MAKKIEHTVSRGNVFADLGLADADEHVAKAEMAVKIARSLEAKKLPQKKRPARQKVPMGSRPKFRGSGA